MSNYASIKSKEFRNLDGTSFRIDNVYFPYLSGWVESQRKFREFVKFPARLTDAVVFSGDERAKPEGDEKMEYREKIWNNGKAEFHKVTEKMDKAFYTLFKKVFDVEVTLATPVTFNVWDSEEKREVKKALTSIRVRGLGSSKIKSMLEDLELDGEVPLVDGKDKAGNPAKVRPFDWEDGIRKNLEGKFVKVKVRGTGMDTKYSFKEGEPFTEDEAQPLVKKDKELDLSDIPF